MIFNHPQPPSTIWEPEFDYDDAALQRLGRKPWQTITANELHGYFVLNLVYHIPLQPELFNYLFPICLAFWQESLFTPGDSGLIDELYRFFFC